MTKRPDFSAMTPAEFAAHCAAGYGRAKAAHDEMVRAGYRLATPDGKSGRGAWVKREGK